MKRSMPIRTCAGCRQRLPWSQLFRLRSDDATTPVVDAVAGVGGGAKRGMWLCARTSCVRRGMQRALRQRRIAVNVVEDVLRLASVRGSLLLANRRAGLKRRAIGHDDAKTTTLAELLVKLTSAVDMAATGA